MPRVARLILMALLLGLTPAAQAGERFIDNGDGTVTDTQMGLMWAATDNNGDIDWHQARKWVQYTFPYTLAVSHDNWRLPSLAELHSLAGTHTGGGYEAECGQRLRLTALIRLSCAWVWSRDAAAVAPTAFAFNFNDVYHYSVRKTHRRDYRALAVRDLSGN